MQRTGLLALAPPDVAVTTDHLLTYLTVSGKATYMPVKPITTRHRASTSMYLLTFRVRVTTPRSVDEMDWRRSRRVDFIAGEGSLRRHA